MWRESQGRVYKYVSPSVLLQLDLKLEQQRVNYVAHHAHGFGRGLCR
jgi:hypothetical protein